MTSPRENLWLAIHDQAALWATTPVVATMAASLPPNAPDRDRRTGAATVAAFLQAFGAGYGVLASRPLLYGSGVTWVRHAGAPIVPDGEVPEEVLRPWLDAAHAVESAHRMTLAWYRSRLPGYPILRVPQLGRETHLTTRFWTSELAWPLEDRRAGWQLQPTVTGIDQVLGSSDKTQLDDAAAVVLAALRATSEWEGFGERRQALSEDDKLALRESRKPLADRLAQTDDEAERSIFGSDTFRRLACAEAVANLPVGARAYAEAFDEVNQLIDLATSDVFGQLTFYGSPTLIPASSVDISSEGVIEFTTTEPAGLRQHPGNLIVVQDPLITDVLRLESMSWSFPALDGPAVTMSARLLDGSSILAGWT